MALRDVLIEKLINGADRIYPLLDDLLLEAKKTNTIQVVANRAAEVKDILPTIGAACNQDSEEFTEKAGYALSDLLKKQGIDFKLNAPNLEIQLADLRPIELDTVEASLRLVRKAGNYASDYSPDKGLESIRATAYFVSPLPLGQVRSTDNRDRYIFTDMLVSGQKAYISGMDFSQLTLLDRFSVVNKEYRILEQLLTGTCRGAFFNAFIQEIAPLGREAWNELKGQKKPNERYGNAVAMWLHFAHGHVDFSAMYRNCDIAALTSSARQIFSLAKLNGMHPTAR